MLKMRFCVKSWENVRECVESWESTPNLRKSKKVRQNLRKYEEVRQNLRKWEKVWECVLNATATANSFLFAVHMQIFFYAQYKSLAPFFWWVGGGGSVCVEVSLRTACCCQKLNRLCKALQKHCTMYTKTQAH